MDQIKIGAFLKMLRTQKGMTQEQLAEHFNVSNRTVSRWETGSNMPDLSMLTELADFYDVDIREIIDGERKSETMNNETKDTLKKVAEYTNEEKKILKSKMLNFSAATLILFIFYMLLDITNGFGFIAARPINNMQNFVLGLIFGILLLNIMYFSGLLEKVKVWKKHLTKAQEV